MPGFDFGSTAYDGKLDIIALGQIFAKSVGKAYDDAVAHAKNITTAGVGWVPAEAGEAGAVPTGNPNDAAGTLKKPAADTFDVGEMANFMLSMMVFGTLLKIMFSITALIKDFGDFAAQKM